MYDTNTFPKFARRVREQERDAMDKRPEEGSRTDLLEQLSIRMGCQYLSDLRGTKRRFQCCSVLAEIPAVAYTTNAWNDAISYITGEKTEYTTQEEAKNGLISRLEMKRSE